MKGKLPRFVLDSFAVLAYIAKEPGGQRVAQALGRARHGQAEVLMSLINFGEVAYIVEREQGLAETQDAIALLDQLPVRVVAADRALTLAAAHLKANYAISSADAFAAALAVKERATILTGDAEFRLVEKLVNVEWLPLT